MPNSRPQPGARAAKRVARRPAEIARQEILDAAAYLLSRQPFREISIGDLMEHTKIGRSAFYVYFKDIYAVAMELIGDVREEVVAYADTWAGETLTPDQALRAFLSDTVNLWSVRGPMIGAILDAAVESPDLARAIDEIMRIYQEALRGILVREQGAGRIRSMDFDETAAALVIGTTAYLKARLGHGGRRDPLKVAATLQDLWAFTIYGGVASA